MKLLTTLAFVAASMSVFAQSPVGIRPWNWQPKNQFSTQSLNVTSTTSSLSVLYLNDGLSNNYTALAYPVFQVTGLGNRVGIYAIGAASMNTPTTKIYAGTALGVNLVKSSGWDVTAYGGLKGLDLTDQVSYRTGKGAWVFGVGVSIPVK